MIVGVLVDIAVCVCARAHVGADLRARARLGGPANLETICGAGDRQNSSVMRLVARTAREHEIQRVVVPSVGAMQEVVNF